MGSKFRKSMSAVLLAFTISLFAGCGNDSGTNPQSTLQQAENEAANEAEVQSNTATSKEIVYKGVALNSLVMGSIEDVVKTFGNPTDEDYYNGGRYYGFNSEIAFFFHEGTHKILHIMTGKPNVLKIGDITLDKNRAGLIKALGNPDSEDAFYDEEEDERGYVMKYNRDGYSITFTMSAPDAKVSEITFSPDQAIEDVPDDDTYLANNNSSKSNSSNKNKSQQTEGVFVLSYPEKIKTSSGNVCRAPLEFTTSSTVSFINIQNPQRVTYGCRIRILTSKNPISGLYQTYAIDEDGRPGGTVFRVVDAAVID